MIIAWRWIPGCVVGLEIWDDWSVQLNLFVIEILFTSRENIDE